jgi:Tfp pilus assembly protein PilO
MNRRLLIPIGIGVAVVILWFVALYGPQSSALSKARKRANDAAQQTATLRDQLNRLQQAQQSQPLKQSQLETLRVAIPDTPNLAQFILDANDAASRAGIDFLSITPTPPSSSSQGATTPTPAGGGGGAAPVPIRVAMTASGGYFQVLDFVNRLNSLPRIVVVDSLQMSAAGSAAALTVSLAERIFTTSPGPVSGGGAGGGGATSTTSPGSTTTTTKPAGG